MLEFSTMMVTCHLYKK